MVSLPTLTDEQTKAATRGLNESWQLGGLTVQNRVVLAPLAGIGNWFVRLQAKRYGAGLVFSEMVSSFGIHYENDRTCAELLRIHPNEHPVAMQLFGNDPDVMYGAAKRVAAVGADIVDLNMGCPVPKVCKTGAGAALVTDPERAIALAVAAREGSGLPVTVKLRPGRRPEDRHGVELAYRLAAEAGVAAITFHPRHASQQHKGTPDYDLVARLVAELPVPVIVSGGLRSAQKVRQVFAYTGAAGVMLARGSFGNPWLFQHLLDGAPGEPDPSVEAVTAEFAWLLERAEEHIGAARAARYLRKFYPWYVDRLSGGDKVLQDRLQRSETLVEAKNVFSEVAMATQNSC